MSRGRLGVFAKAPRPGRVKTRLTPVLSPEQAAAFFDAMLADVLEASLAFARRLALEPCLYFDPPEARAELAARAPDGFRLLAQQGADLGERMANAFAEAHASGCPVLLLRGSDCPALGPEVVEEALERLEAGADLVLTPDQGGGYALIGMKEPRAALFALRLSTATVLDETLARARSLGLRAEQTPPTFDLDLPSDLARLEALAPDRSSDLCPRTVEFHRSLRRIGVL